METSGHAVVEEAATDVIALGQAQGFVEATAAGLITCEDSLVFERVHELTYRELGFELVEVPTDPLAGRVALVRQTVEGLRR